MNGWQAKRYDYSYYFRKQLNDVLLSTTGSQTLHAMKELAKTGPKVRTTTEATMPKTCYETVAPSIANLMRVNESQLQEIERLRGQVGQLLNWQSIFWADDNENDPSSPSSTDESQAHACDLEDKPSAPAEEAFFWSI